MSRGMRPGWRHFVRGIAAGTTLLIVTGGLSGCGGEEPEPTATATHPVTAKPTPMPTPTPTPTPTPSLAPEQIPPTAPAALTDVGADGASKDEAEAVARYFLELYPYVASTGDLNQWQALADPECVFCASVVTNVSAQRDAGSHTSGGMFELTVTMDQEVDPGKFFTITFDVKEAENATVDSTGSVIDSSPAAHYTVIVIVTYDAGRWAAREAEYEKLAQ